MINHIDGIELQDVLDYILKCKDNEELSTISSVIKDKRKYNASHLKYQLQIGDEVKISGWKTLGGYDADYRKGIKPPTTCLIHNSEEEEENEWIFEILEYNK